MPRLLKRIQIEQSINIVLRCEFTNCKYLFYLIKFTNPVFTIFSPLL
jgi:hypothetical protein